jgi:hypothetical protein
MTAPVEIGIGAWSLQTTYMRPRRRPRCTGRLPVRLGWSRISGSILSGWREHHLSYDGYCPSVLPAAAVLLVATARIKVGTSVLVFFHSAERVAESCAALGAIAPGRTRLGLGIGYRPIEFAAEGVAFETAARFGCSVLAM